MGWWWAPKLRAGRRSREQRRDLGSLDAIDGGAVRGRLRGVVWAVCCMVLYGCMLIQRCMALYGCMAPGGRRDDACLLYGAIQLYWFKGVVRSQRDLGR